MNNIEQIISQYAWEGQSDGTAHEMLSDIRSKIGASLFDRLLLPESQTAKDYANPNVLLIEGRLTSWEGEWSATGVQTASGHVYLAEVIEKLLGWKGIATFSWHLASEQKSFYELEENLVKTAMGTVETKFHHAHSDLTGYLWTTESIKAGGHDVLNEILDTAAAMKGTVYLAMRVEKQGK